MKLKHDIKHAMGQLRIDALCRHQIKPVDSILDGRDTLVIAPTGSGKSAMFQVPALVMHQKQHDWTLVIEPTQVPAGMKSANMVSSSTMSVSSTALSTTKMKWMMIPGHDSATDCPGGGGPAENKPTAGPENDSQRIASRCQNRAGVAR